MDESQKYYAEYKKPYTEYTLYDYTFATLYNGQN